MSDEQRTWLVLQASTTKPRAIVMDGAAAIYDGCTAEQAALAFLERVATADACAVVPYTSPRYFTARLSAHEDTDTSTTEAE